MAELQAVVKALGAGVPKGCLQPMTCSVEDGACTFSLQAKVCEMVVRFVPYEGVWELSFDLYSLPSHLQNTGHSKRMFRDLLIICDRLGVAFIVAYANFEIGGYTWAKMAARATEPELHRQLLLKRLADRVAKGLIPAESQIPLETLIKSAPMGQLMYDIACSASRDGQPLGKPLLLGHSWDAFWDLSDPGHRSMISEALS